MSEQLPIGTRPWVCPPVLKRNKSKRKSCLEWNVSVDESTVGEAIVYTSGKLSPHTCKSNFLTGFLAFPASLDAAAKYIFLKYILM